MLTPVVSNCSELGDLYLLQFSVASNCIFFQDNTFYKNAWLLKIMFLEKKLNLI